MNEMNKTFAKNLKTQMVKRGKRAVDITRDLGVPSATISAWCNGRIPRPASLETLCDYLDCTSEELLCDADVLNTGVLSRTGGDANRLKSLLLLEAVEDDKLEQVNNILKTFIDVAYYQKIIKSLYS